jgi:hypothetical protein
MESVRKQKKRERDRASVPGPKPGIGIFHANRSYIWIHRGLRWTGDQGERADILGDVTNRVRKGIWETLSGY